MTELQSARAVRVFRAAVLVATAPLLLLAGCGSDDEASTTTTSTGGDTEMTTETTTADDLESLPDISMPASEFETAPNATVRFANFYVRDGAGVDVDVYWGYNAETGKKAMTIPYGATSEPTPIEVEVNSFSQPGDPRDVRIAFYPAGKTEQTDQLMVETQTLEDPYDLVVAMGWRQSSSPTDSGFTIQTAFVHEMGEAPAGKGVLMFNDIGVQGVEGGSFMTPSAAGQCSQWSIDNEFQSANAGTSYVQDPASLTITASDANSDCSVTTPPVTVDLQAGDRWMLFAYGITKEDRKLVPLKVG